MAGSETNLAWYVLFDLLIVFLSLNKLPIFLSEKCQGSGILDQIRHLSRSNFESPWHPSVVRQEIKSIVAAEGYNSYEKYIMWKVKKYNQNSNLLD